MKKDDMVNEYVEINDNEIIITGKSPSLVSKIILGILVFFICLAPVIMTINVLFSGKGIPFAIVFLYLLFAFAGFFILRIFLWNVYGREIIQFHGDKIEYCCDFKLFIANRQGINAKDLRISINEIKVKDERKATIVLNDSSSRVESALEIPESDMQRVVEKIGEIYQLEPTGLFS